jgi:hypothetical protein
VRRLGSERCIVEHQGALVARAARRQIAPSKEPAWPGGQGFIELVTARPRGGHRRFDVGRRSGQIHPAVYRRASRVAGVRLVDHHPDVLGKAAADAFVRREPANRRVGIAQRNSMFVVPGDEQGLAISIEAERASAFAGHDANPFGGIEVVDTAQRGQLQAGFAGIGVELQRACPDNGVIGHELRGFEIPLDARVLHELHVAEVGETLTTDRVAGRIDADLDVDAGQIAKRIRVLGAGQPADRHASGIAGVLGLVRAQGGADPGHGRRAFVVCREQVRLVRRRHLACFEHRRHLVPVLPIPADGRLSGLADETFEADTALALGAAVAFEAVLLKGLRRPEGLGRRGAGAVGRRGLGRDH